MRILALLLACLPLLSAAPHKFYVSKTTIEFSARTQIYEITSKLFTDDLERALGGTADNPLHLGDENEVSNADALLTAYLDKHFRITYNNEVLQLSYVGKEVENDLTYCYLEFVRSPNFSVITVENTIFYEVFPEQQNIVDLVVNGSTRTSILTKEKQSDVFYR